MKLFNRLKNIKFNVLCMLAVLMAVPGIGAAAGLMTPADGRPELTLAEQHVEVVVENGYAVTSVEQVYANPHASDFDALYSFPVPDKAVVGEFTYWIDGVAVHAEVLEKEKARKLHDEQRSQGNDTALLEQDEYRTFDMHVSPVRAGQDVRTRLVYLQRAAVDHSVGRYVYPLEEGGADEERNTFWTRNDTVASAFTFKMKLRSAYPVDAVRVPTGSATVQQIDSGEWEVVIDAQAGAGASVGAGLTDVDLDIAANAQAATGGQTINANQVAGGVHQLDKDIVIYWRLAENLPGAVDLVTYREAGAAQGTFMLTLTPGIDLQPITEGRDWVFVLDVSGSMEGKYHSLVESVRHGLAQLSPIDRFQVILFSNSATSLTRGYVPADETSVRKVLKKLDNYQVGGGTNLYDGLKKAVRALDSDRTTAIVLVTDGVANVGPSELSDFLEMMEKVDVRLFTAVMGNSANKPLLSALTEHSEGFSVNVSNSDDIVGLMLQVTGKVTHEALHNVRISVDGVRVSDITPEKFSRVYRGEQLVLLGKYTGDGEAKVSLKTEISGESKTYSSKLLFADVSAENPELERLWAFATIESLQERQRLLGKTDDTEQAITDMALSHGLVTDNTSLIVVREEVFQQNNIQRNNASRVQRERLAREQRALQVIPRTRQDAQAPMFSAPRHTTSNGGGSIGLWILLIIGLIGMSRFFLNVRDKSRLREKAGS